MTKESSSSTPNVHNNIKFFGFYFFAFLDQRKFCIHLTATLNISNVIYNLSLISLNIKFLDMVLIFFVFTSTKDLLTENCIVLQI